MIETSYPAMVVNGQIVLSAHVRLPENTKVFVVVPASAAESPGRIRSPRLARPEQAADFQMDVTEIADAGV